MTTIAPQITSLAFVYSTVYSDADHRKHQSSALLAFVWGIHRDRWIPRTKGQLRGKCFHLMASSCFQPVRLEHKETMDVAVFIIITASLHTVESEVVVNLIMKQLFEFPDNITPSVERLHMGSHFIERISATDLSTFLNLTHLDLDNNTIKYLEDGCFHSNIRLTNLELSFTMIVYFPVSLGPIITSLRVLSLSGSITPNITNFDLRPLHRMYWIGLQQNNFEEMGIDILSRLPSATKALALQTCSIHQFPHFDVHMPAIQNIMLTENYLTELSFDDFRNLSNLETLKLDRNNLTTLPDLYNHSSLTTLFLKENPLVCDHALCWIVMWSHTRTPALTLDAATCQKPTELQGVLLADLHPLNIGCYAG